MSIIGETSIRQDQWVDIETKGDFMSFVRWGFYKERKKSKEKKTKTEHIKNQWSGSHPFAPGLHWDQQPLEARVSADYDGLRTQHIAGGSGKVLKEMCKGIRAQVTAQWWQWTETEDKKETEA